MPAELFGCQPASDATGFVGSAADDLLIELPPLPLAIARNKFLVQQGQVLGTVFAPLVQAGRDVACELSSHGFEASVVPP